MKSSSLRVPGFQPVLLPAVAAEPSNQPVAETQARSTRQAQGDTAGHSNQPFTPRLKRSHETSTLSVENPSCSASASGGGRACVRACVQIKRFALLFDAYGAAATARGTYASIANQGRSHSQHENLFLGQSCVALASSPRVVPRPRASQMWRPRRLTARRRPAASAPAHLPILSSLHPCA